MIEKTKKNFPLSYGDLIAEGMAYIHSYEVHWKLFHGKYPDDFPEDYHVIAKQTITAVKTVYSDEYMLKEMASDTEMLDELQVTFYDLTPDILYKAEKAFGKKSADYSRFVIGKPQSGKNSRSSYALKISDYARLVREYDVELKAQGVKEEQIQEIEKLALQIENQQWERVSSKFNRTTSTKGRISAFNEIWDIIVHIHNGSLSVCHGNADLLALFALPKRRVRKKHEDDTTLPA